jgi:hypothetical protein
MACNYEQYTRPVITTDDNEGRLVREIKIKMYPTYRKKQVKTL